jgi:hypothetical protein
MRPGDEPHFYLSCACRHDKHRICRRACKHCLAPCMCLCHEQQTQPVRSETMSEQQPENPTADAPEAEGSAPQQAPEAVEPASDDVGAALDAMGGDQPDPENTDDYVDAPQDIPGDGDE